MNVSKNQIQVLKSCHHVRTYHNSSYSAFSNFAMILPSISTEKQTFPECSCAIRKEKM